MKFWLIIFFCIVANCVLAQNNKKLFASGTSSNLYITHPVVTKDTYVTLAKKYNLSPTIIAQYNNLEFHKGKLSAKYLKIPLSKKNFTLTDRPVTKALAVYKIKNNKPRIIGYINSNQSVIAPLKTSKVQSTKKVAIVSKQSDTALHQQPTIAVKKVIPNLNATKASTKQVQVKSTPAKPTKDWIKRSKKNKLQERFGPGKFIKEFYTVAILITIITIVLIVAIFSYVSIKRKRSFIALQLRQDIITGLSDAILHSKIDDLSTNQSYILPQALKSKLNLPQVRQLVIDELIKAKRSFRGQGAENLIKLYTQLGLSKDSLLKLNSKHWYVKAKGIQELAALDQTQYLFKIFRQTNSKNENVRTEAQSAIVSFAGFSGLRFLKVLTFPISDWQQMKLLDQLALVSEPDLPGAKHLLKSTNDSVVIFILKLISVFHLLHLHDAVVGCLYYRSATIRFYAIKCLQQIYKQTTAGILENFYAEEELKNKIAILEAIKVMGSDAQTDFIYLELFNKNDNIKLVAAEALMTCCTEGLQLIQDVSINNGHPYTNILKHVREGALL